MARSIGRSGGASIHGVIYEDTITPHLDYLVAFAAENVAHAMSEGATRVQEYAQANAPWADRTGAARAGLTADSSFDGGVITITLEHSVDYGEWLEVIQDGRFAIIMPTLELLGPQIIHEAGGHVMDIGSI